MLSKLKACAEHHTTPLTSPSPFHYLSCWTLWGSKPSRGKLSRLDVNISDDGYHRGQVSCYNNHSMWLWYHPNSPVFSCSCHLMKKHVQSLCQHATHLTPFTLISLPTCIWRKGTASLAFGWEHLEGLSLPFTVWNLCLATVSYFYLPLPKRHLSASELVLKDSESLTRTRF